MYAIRSYYASCLNWRAYLAISGTFSFTMPFLQGIILEQRVVTMKIPPRTLHTLFPFLRWWPMVNRHTLRDDLLAGSTGALVVLPQGVAFATIAGLPPEYGLYAAMVPTVIAALFGSSWHLVSGPTTAISVALYAVLSQNFEPGSSQYIST